MYIFNNSKIARSVLQVFLLIPFIILIILQTQKDKMVILEEEGPDGKMIKSKEKVLQIMYEPNVAEKQFLVLYLLSICICPCI